MGKLKEFGKKAKESLKKAGHDVEDAAKKVGHGMENLGRAAKHAYKGDKKGKSNEEAPTNAVETAQESAKTAETVQKPAEWDAATTSTIITEDKETFPKAVLTLLAQNKKFLQLFQEVIGEFAPEETMEALRRAIKSAEEGSEESLQPGDNEKVIELFQHLTIFGFKVGVLVTAIHENDEKTAEAMFTEFSDFLKPYIEEVKQKREAKKKAFDELFKQLVRETVEGEQPAEQSLTSVGDEPVVPKGDYNQSLGQEQQQESPSLAEEFSELDQQPQQQFYIPEEGC